MPWKACTFTVLQIWKSVNRIRSICYGVSQIILSAIIPQNRFMRNTSFSPGSLSMRKEVEKRFYAPYFHSFTRTQGNVTYNFLLGMFWNPQTKMWVNSQNGEISWSLFSESAWAKKEQQESCCLFLCQNLLNGIGHIFFFILRKRPHISRSG